MLIHYDPEGYRMDGPQLMGRHAAGAGFLRGYFTYARAERFAALVRERRHLGMFTATARSCGRSEPCVGIPFSDIDKIPPFGTVYLPGPGVEAMAWRRSLRGARSFSLMGVTHTTATDRTMDGIAGLLAAPVMPWDALVCTSRAVRDTLRVVLEAQADYLRHRLGAVRFPLPRLPLIPLGVHCDDFVFSPDQRQEARQRLGCGGETLVLLFVGRLSSHAKAHPLAMYQALAMAADGRDVLLVECGWHANEAIARSFEEARLAVCPSLRAVTLDGRRPGERAIAWAAADIFCSLSDNIQETFGLTPLEAMAAGLPVVVSDWDGYRDTVRHGVDGFLVPTTQPPPGMGRELVRRYALGVDSYDMYCGNASQLVAVDIDAATKAFASLFSSLEERRRMGEAGRKRARQFFDWSGIIARYESLNAELAEIRRAHPETVHDPLPGHPWPARLDPFIAFGSYPSRVLGVEDEVERGGNDPEKTAVLAHLAMVRPFAPAHVPEDDRRRIWEALAERPKSVKEILGLFPERRQGGVFRGLVWLLKLGSLRLHGGGPRTAKGNPARNFKEDNR